MVRSPLIRTDRQPSRLTKEALATASVRSWPDCCPLFELATDRQLRCSLAAYGCTRNDSADRECGPEFETIRRRNWRRGRDSNPRCPQRHNGFRDRPVRPLRHLSAGGSFRTTGTPGWPAGADTSRSPGLPQSVSGPSFSYPVQTPSPARVFRPLCRLFAGQRWRSAFFSSPLVMPERPSTPTFFAFS